MGSGIVIIFVLLLGKFNLITCEQFQLKREHLDKALFGHTISEINGTSQHDCARDCLSIALCKAFDYDKNERSCKLNDADSSSVDSSEIITKKGSIFSDISEWPSAMVHECDTRPCKMDQKCIVNGDSYVCRDITCAVFQQLEHGYIHVIAPDKNKFRDKALVKCGNGYIPSQQEVECQVSGHWQPAICEKTLRSDCKDILDQIPESNSGVYEIELWESGKVISVYCDMETEGGGWTRRIDGSVEFYRNFSEYENGFGNVDGELWLGLKTIQEMANQAATDLRFDVTNATNGTGQETFHDFKLTEGFKYKLSLGTRYSSTITASVIGTNKNRPFSTFDLDRDRGGSYNCAEIQHGAWWYNQCSDINLNGLYAAPGTQCTYPGASKGKCGIFHFAFNWLKSLKRTSMMLRRV